MEVDSDLKQKTDDTKSQEVNPVYIINTIRKAQKTGIVTNIKLTFKLMFEEGNHRYVQYNQLQMQIEK